MVSFQQSARKMKTNNVAEKITKPTKKSKKTRLTIEKECTNQVIPKNIKSEVNKSKIKYLMPSKSITEELVKANLKALSELAVHYKNKRAIFGDESPVFAEIKCIKIQNTKGNIKFVLPHSTVASTGEVCLVTPDLKKGKKPDHEPTIDHWEEILQKAGVTNVKTILPMRQLRVEYDQFELKRRLLTQHDIIMVDTRVLNHVSHVLGKMFFKKHNMLIPVRINEKEDIKKDIDVGLRTVMLRLNIGHTSTVIIGHTGMSQQDLKENIMSLVKQLCTKYPGGEANIRSISIKLPLSLSLPLYLTLRPSHTVNIPKLIHKKPKQCSVVEGELSTVPGAIISVAPEGTVRLKHSKGNESGLEDVINDDSEVDSSSDMEDTKSE